MKIRLLLPALCLMPLSAFAANIEVQISASSLLSPPARSKNACYQAAEQLKAAGIIPVQTVVKKQSISVLPGDVYYNLYTSEKGSKCALLNEEKTQSGSWDQNLAQIAGCICDFTVPIN